MLTFMERHRSSNNHEAYYHAGASTRYGICYKLITQYVYTTGDSVICFKDNDFIFLERNIYADLSWIAKKPTRYQAELLKLYFKKLKSYNYTNEFYREVMKLKKGETLENKYGIKTKMIKKFVDSGCPSLMSFQQKYRKGMAFYDNVRLYKLERLWQTFGKEPFFKLIYNYSSEDAPFFCVSNYCDYMCMRNKLIKHKRINAKDWPVAPSVENVVKVHDKITPIFNRYQETKSIKELAGKQREYVKEHYKNAKAYEANNKDFSIIACKKLVELIIEGRELHHCVGSYVDSVSKGREYILFLRRNKEMNKPFYTIDVTPNGEIRQIHGDYNCNISDEIKDFVDEWAKKFKLKFAENRVLCHL